MSESVHIRTARSQLERLAPWFPPEQVLVLLYEDCVRDPAAALARTYAFVGLDPSHVPAGLTQRVHETTGPKPTVDAEQQERLRLAYRAEVDITE